MSDQLKLMFPERIDGGHNGGPALAQNDVAQSGRAFQFPPISELAQNDAVPLELSLFNDLRIDFLVESVMQDSKYLFHSIAGDVIKKITCDGSKHVPISYPLNANKKKWIFILDRNTRKISFLAKYAKGYKVEDIPEVENWAVSHCIEKGWGYVWELESLYSLKTHVAQKNRLNVSELKAVAVNKLKKVKLEEVAIE